MKKKSKSKGIDIKLLITFLLLIASQLFAISDLSIAHQNQINVGQEIDQMEVWEDVVIIAHQNPGYKISFFDSNTLEEIIAINTGANGKTTFTVIDSVMYTITYGTMKAYNLNTLPNIEMIDSIEGLQWGTSIGSNSTYSNNLYIGDHSSIINVDITNPNNIEMINTFSNIGHFTYTMAFSGNYLISASQYGASLSIIDLQSEDIIIDDDFFPNSSNNRKCSAPNFGGYGLNLIDNNINIDGFLAIKDGINFDLFVRNDYQFNSVFSTFCTDYLITMGSLQSRFSNILFLDAGNIIEKTLDLSTLSEESISCINTTSFPITSAKKISARKFYNQVTYFNQNNEIFVVSTDFLYRLNLETVNVRFRTTETQGVEPFAIEFFNQAERYPNYTTGWTYEWDFENDGIVDSYDNNPIWTYQHAGTYDVSLTVSNGNISDTMIKEDYITVELSEPAPPGNLQINIENGNANLSWSISDSTIAGTPIDVDYYLVYYSEYPEQDSLFFFHGYTTETNYTHSGVATFSEQMFYKIESFVGSSRQLENHIEMIYERERIMKNSHNK